MFSAMIGMPTARSSSAATLMSPPMIEPARTSSRARGRSATARTAAAMFASPTSGIVSTLIRSPRRLWRSASLTAPSATWATCAPPPTTMTRLPKTRAQRAGQVDGPDVLESLERRDERRPRRRPRPRARSRRAAASPSIAADRRERPDARRRRRRPRAAIGGDRLGAVDDIEADGGGLGRPRRGIAGVGPASAQACRDRPRRAEVVDRQRVGLAARRSGRAPRRRARALERLARRRGVATSSASARRRCPRRRRRSR